MTMTAQSEGAPHLRNAMVDQLIQAGEITTTEVERVMRTVPRHAFAPEASSLKAAHAPYDAVPVKTHADGHVLSSVSAPQIQALMLEQAQIRPGDRVLEIGSGGLNAAYLAELSGPDGYVVTADIDPDVTARAARLLTQHGYEQVQVVCADADSGIPEHGPYDAIVVTAGAWDVPPGWREQLVEGGRLVVPLRLRGLTRTIGFRKHGTVLESASAHVCGFVPVRGQGDHHGDELLVRGTREIVLFFDDGIPTNTGPLADAVTGPRTETWTGVTVRRMEPIGTLQLYLATTLPGFCRISVDKDLDTGLVTPTSPALSIAAVDGTTLACLTTRRTSDDQSVECGIHAFGPDRAAMADTITGHLRSWDRHHRGGPGPAITVHPSSIRADTLDADRVITKRHSHVTLTWRKRPSQDS